MTRLFVVPTPIGNLEDITIRAVHVLSEVSLILAEDTRHTRKLLQRYGITTRLLSYHHHNERSRLDSVLTTLETEDVALVSDAGMPAVSDPGFEVIRAAVAAGVDVDVLPGPSAVVTAVVAAAIPASGFLFLGFLPRKSSARRQRLEEVKSLPYSLVIYEAPHRLVQTLEGIESVLGDRMAAAARELSKLHQEVIRGRVSELRARFEAREPRGEFTLVVAGAEETADDRTDQAREEIMACRRRGESRRTALDTLMQQFGLSRNEAYRLWIEAEEDTRD